MVVAAVVVAAAGVGALLWHLNTDDGAVQPTATGPGAGAVPDPGATSLPPSEAVLPDSVPPLGAVRPPRDLLLPSLEQPVEEPRWIYRLAGDLRNANLLGGDSYTLVIGTPEGLMALDAVSGEPRWAEAGHAGRFGG